jgi:hypothetical protein
MHKIALITDSNYEHITKNQILIYDPDPIFSQLRSESIMHRKSKECKSDGNDIDSMSEAKQLNQIGGQISQKLEL